jgi:hypothetical protein
MKLLVMNRFKFLDPGWREVEPKSWVNPWATRYTGGDNKDYFDLMAKRGELSGEDFELIGKWKEGCLTPNHGSWKTETPRAYDVWMQASSILPTRPGQSRVAEFLQDWSERTFAAGKKNGMVMRYRFGLSRSTTLLHFISVGLYPILDANVASAMKRLGSPVQITIAGYLDYFCPLFSEIASTCGVSGIEGLRKLDNALFAFGSDSSFPGFA